ncbi:MAG TPA: hypothetical protein VGC95_11115, partial [Chitinophagaceae bacterium]
MKKFFACYYFVFVVFFANSQEVFEPKITLKWAPTGLILGDASFQGEYSFLHKASLTVKIGVPFNRIYHADFDGHNVDMSMKAVSFLAGYRKYLSHHELRGFYVEPFFTYAHHTSDGTGNGKLNAQPISMDFTNAYNGIGAGVQLGTQFIIAKRLVIDLFFF